MYTGVFVGCWHPFILKAYCLKANHKGHSDVTFTHKSFQVRALTMALTAAEKLAKKEEKALAKAQAQVLALGITPDATATIEDLNEIIANASDSTTPPPTGDQTPVAGISTLIANKAGEMKLWKFSLEGANLFPIKLNVRLTHAYSIDKLVGDSATNNNVVMFRYFSEAGDALEFGSNKSFLTTGKKTIRLFKEFDEQGVPTNLKSGDAAFACELNGLRKQANVSTWACFDEEVYENAPKSARGTSYYDGVQKHPCVWILDDVSLPFVFETFGSKIGKQGAAKFDAIVDQMIVVESTSKARRKDELDEVTHTTDNLAILKQGAANEAAIAAAAVTAKMITYKAMITGGMDAVIAGKIVFG